jgi:hypothetical protein
MGWLRSPIKGFQENTCGGMAEESIKRIPGEYL